MVSLTNLRPIQPETCGSPGRSPGSEPTDRFWSPRKRITYWKSWKLALVKVSEAWAGPAPPGARRTWSLPGGTPDHRDGEQALLERPKSESESRGRVT